VFLAAAGTAGEYPLEHAAGHRSALAATLADAAMEPAA